MEKRTSYNYSKLLGRLKEVGMTQEQLSSEISTNPTTLSFKLNNKGIFKQNDIKKICAVLHIVPEEIGLYFFTH